MLPACFLGSSWGVSVLSENGKDISQLFQSWTIPKSFIRNRFSDVKRSIWPYAKRGYLITGPAFHALIQTASNARAQSIHTYSCRLNVHQSQAWLSWIAGKQQSHTCGVFWSLSSAHHKKGKWHRSKCLPGWYNSVCFRLWHRQQHMYCFDRI